jgi:hypothetical protein
MPGLYDLRDQLLHDEKITDDEVRVLQEYIASDGKLDMQDVRLLVELLSDAKEVCPAFDELFFPALKEVLLADGRIDPNEQFYLLKMIYSDGHVRDSERKFLQDLRAEVREATPEFEQLCETALAAPASNWNVGGR